MPLKLSFIPDEHQLGIARVAIAAAGLDMVVEKIVYLAHGQEEQITEFVLKNLHASRIVDLLQTLLVARLPDYQSHIDDLFARIKDCRTSRNALLHWFYEKSDDESKVKLSDKRPFRTTPPKDLTADDIHSLADAIDDCTGELAEWMHLHDALGELSLHGKRGQQSHPPHWALPSKLRQQGT